MISQEVYNTHSNLIFLQALNPEVTVKQGQKVELTCEVKVDGVMKEDIKWYKDGEEVTKGISTDRSIKL